MIPQLILTVMMILSSSLRVLLRLMRFAKVTDVLSPRDIQVTVDFLFLLAVFTTFDDT